MEISTEDELYKRKRDDEIEDKNFDIYYNRRQFFDETRIKISDSFDKYLLTFATGSLYLSVIFTNSISCDLISKNILAIGWISLIFSIIMILISFNLSEAAHKRQMSITDAQIEALKNGKTAVGMENCWNKAISYSKFISMIFFILGIVFLGYFYFVNLK